MREPGGELTECLEPARPPLLFFVTGSLAQSRFDLGLDVASRLRSRSSSGTAALPLLAQACGELADFDRIERLAQHDEPVAGVAAGLTMSSHE